MFNNPRLKKGSADIFIPKGKQVTLETADQLDLGTCTPEGEYVPIKTIMQERTTFKSPGVICIKTLKEEDIWFIDYQTDDITFDPSDPVPVEAAISEAPTMLDRMRAMIYQELAHQGQLNEVESLEEAMDFDIDGDGFVGSQYEIMEEEFLDIPDQGGSDTSATSETENPDVQQTTDYPESAAAGASPDSSTKPESGTPTD
jgi:hypothetical protein